MVRNYDSTLHLKHMKLRLQIFLHAPPTLQLGCLMKCKVYNEPKLLVIQELPWVLRLRVCTLHFVYVLLLLAWILVVLAAAVHDVTAASADYILQYWSTVSLSEKKTPPYTWPDFCILCAQLVRFMAKILHWKSLFYGKKAVSRVLCSNRI